MKRAGSPDRPSHAAPPTDRRAVLAEALARLAPRLPDFEAEAVLDRALRSPGLRGAVPETAVWLALTAVSYTHLTLPTNSLV